MALNWRRLVGFDKPPDSTGLGPDFPGSAGDRERSKFRESGFPRLTTVAVVDDDGESLSKEPTELLEELVREMRLLRHALVLGGFAADIDEPIN